MPAEEGLGPHNVEHLFPVTGGPCEYDEKQAIGPGTWWTLHLTAKDDQLLSQQRILGDEFSPGAGQIGERPCQKDRLLGRVQRNTRCWIRLNVCWHRRLNAMSRVATTIMVPSK